jgi:hypothetical protein
VLALLLITLTAWRLARAIAKDDFPPSVAVRTWVAERTGQGSAWHYLVECVPCASAYTSGLIVVGTIATVGLPAPCLVWGAAAGAAVVLHTAERLAEAATAFLAPEPDNG